MAIVLENPFTPPTPVYDKVHLDYLTITLEKTNYSKAQIQARVRLYATDPSTNEKTFSPETRDISIADCEAFAMSLAQSGDMRGASAMNNIKELVAFLVDTSTDLGKTTVE
jgi:hypothetical protein